MHASSPFFFGIEKDAVVHEGTRRLKCELLAAGITSGGQLISELL